VTRARGAWGRKKDKVSEAVREAIEKHIAERRADEQFQKRLKQLLEEDQQVLKRLAQ